MPFDWKEYLELAKALVHQAHGAGFTEARQRTAVSRAYYGAFGFAREYAEKHLQFKPTHQPKDHQDLREHFKRVGKAQLASRLNKLRSWRNACDYDNQVPDLQDCVREAIKVADQVIRECR